MAFIKDALSSLPAKPALFIAPLLVVLVLTLYYRDQYEKCVAIRQSRADLNEMLRTIDSPGQFRLADFADFAWNRVRIVSRVEPGTISDQCPLDWNWRGDERESLLGSGRLTAVIFGYQGKVVRYLELRADEVVFRDADGELTPATAIFELRRENGRDGGVTLTLKK
jgi:hypothetical protein